MPCIECERLLRGYRKFKAKHARLVVLRDEAAKRGDSAKLDGLNHSLVEWSEVCEWAHLAIRSHQQEAHPD